MVEKDKKEEKQPNNKYWKYYNIYKNSNLKQIAL